MIVRRVALLIATVSITATACGSPSSAATADPTSTLAPPSASPAASASAGASQSAARSGTESSTAFHVVGLTLKANPADVTIQDGAEPVAVHVREVAGDERVAWWDRAVAAYPDYAEYQRRTERTIPVFVATRTD